VEQINMSKEYEFVDAKKPLTLHVSEADINGAVALDFKRCVLTRTVRREHRCFDITVLRTVAYVRKTENSIPLRYQVTGSCRDLLISFDSSGRCHPITVTFTPPRYGISHKNYQSPRRKEINRRSRKKRDQELAAGGTGHRRAYTKPAPLTLIGVRNGTGIRPPGKGKMAKVGEDHG
jgi:hypothetical protein